MIEKAELEKLDDVTLKQFAADAGVEFTDATSREALIEATNIAVNGPPEEFEGDSTAETAMKMDAVLKDPVAAGLPVDANGDVKVFIQGKSPEELDKINADLNALKADPPLAPDAKPLATDWPETPQQVLDALRGHISRGLKVTFTDNQTCWQFDVGLKQSAGTMKMPLKQIVAQAGLLFVKTSAPIEGDDFDEITNLRYKQLKKAR
jgi:hypothetical protein